MALPDIRQLNVMELSLLVAVMKDGRIWVVNSSTMVGVEIDPTTPFTDVIDALMDDK